MSNKARSRKRKHLIKLFKGAMNYIKACVEIRTLIQKEREKNYPKLASGGMVYIHKGNADNLIQGCEMISPFLNHKFDIEAKRLDRLEKINGKWTQPAVIVKNKITE